MINLKDYYNEEENYSIPLPICVLDTKEDWIRKHDRLMKRYPDYPKNSIMECAEFVIEKKLAERIKEGGVPVWFIFDKDCTISEYICNEEALLYSEKKVCEEEDRYWMNNRKYTGNGNKIKTLRFHDKENTWHVTVECIHWASSFLAFDEEEMTFFEENFNSTYPRKLRIWMDETTDRQLDEYADGLIKEEDMFDYVPNRLWHFFFLGKVISTNL